MRLEHNLIQGAGIGVFITSRLLKNNQIRNTLIVRHPLLPLSTPALIQSFGAKTGLLIRAGHARPLGQVMSG